MEDYTSQEANVCKPRLPPESCTRPLIAFKLRFATKAEPGRSAVSSVKPLRLPSTVTEKFYTKNYKTSSDANIEKGTERAYQNIQDMFSKGPADKHDKPLTTSHEYGWWIVRKEEEPSSNLYQDRRLNHHIRDSAWMKECIRILAPDAKHRPK